MSAIEQTPGTEKLIFACSGSADVGSIADRVARSLARDGEGMMSCLSALNGRIPEIIRMAKRAKKILAIDGCPNECTAKCLKKAGVDNFEHLRLEDLDFEKWKCPESNENIASAAAIGSELLA